MPYVPITTTKMSDLDSDHALSSQWDASQLPESSYLELQASQATRTPTPQPRKRAATGVSSQALKPTKRRRSMKDRGNSAAGGRNYWKEEHVGYIIKLLAKIKDKGGMAEGGFKASHWHMVLKKLKNKYPNLKDKTDLTYQKVRSKYDSYKRLYSIFKKHQQHVSGWVIGDDEVPRTEQSEMDKHADAYPDCARWLDQAPPFFVELDILLEGRLATGRHAILPGDDTESSTDSSEVGSDDISEPTDDEISPGSGKDASGSDDESTSTQSTTPSRSSSISSSSTPSTSSSTKLSKKADQDRLTMLKRATTTSTKRSARGATKIAHAISQGNEGFIQSMKQIAEAITAFSGGGGGSAMPKEVRDAMEVVSKLDCLDIGDRAYIMESFTTQQAIVFMMLKSQEDRMAWIQLKLRSRITTFGGFS